MDEKLMKTLRAQAWERAKGELHAALSTFWGEAEEFGAADDAVKKFIAKVEDDGLFQ